MKVTCNDDYGSIRSRSGPPKVTINEEEEENSTRSASKGYALVRVVLGISSACILLLLLQEALVIKGVSKQENVLLSLSIPLEGRSQSKSSSEFTTFSTTTNSPYISIRNWQVPKAEQRCEYIIETFTAQHDNLPRHVLINAYAKQVLNTNTFYRATATIFWKDFARNAWDDQIYSLLESNPENDKSTWTWVTGDQHLSNFGAWRNLNDNVVFSVNDFDEAAIYDFHIDVIRLAVSIYDHAQFNGFSPNQIQKILIAFTDTYIETIMSYMGNEDAETFELTQDTAEGLLRHFLRDVTKDNTHYAQLQKFVDENRRFRLDNTTHLVSLNNTRNSNANYSHPDELEHIIRRTFSSQQYGATMMKTGWHVPVWDDSYFAVLDVARRTGSGIGSFGVDRYYVLINGTGHGQHFILDVKYEPPGGVASVLSDDDRAWYGVIFVNEAARAVEAQRRLMSYVDPFTGWVSMHGKAFVVRQRGPWKDSPDLDAITDYHDFKTFAKQLAKVTATSHTRGSPAKAPGEFKQVIAKLLGSNHRDKEMWGWAVGQITEAYSEQVKMDYQCFRDFVEAHYPEAIAQQNSD